MAEADGNRTARELVAPSSVLKTAGPTRNPDASAVEDNGTLGRFRRPGYTRPYGIEIADP